MSFDENAYVHKVDDPELYDRKSSTPSMELCMKDRIKVCAKGKIHFTVVQLVRTQRIASLQTQLMNELDEFKAKEMNLHSGWHAHNTHITRINTCTEPRHR